jgi:rhamnosyltransferase
LNKVSVVIRNRNEAFYLQKTLEILNSVYEKDILEIILIDNESTDDSLQIASDHGCRILKIIEFTYGKAINQGISEARSNFVLLLSSHAVPVGNSFFKNSIKLMVSNSKISGIRYINSISNYERALKNNFKVNDPLRFGLAAGCCMINRKVWEKYKFDESLSANEDKEWSLRTTTAGYYILDMNEGYFYFINRSQNSLVSRFRNETLADFQLNNKNFPSRFKIFLTFVYSVTVKNTVEFFKRMRYDYKIMKAKFYISDKLKN